MITPCSSKTSPVLFLCAIVVVRILFGLSPLFSLASYCLCLKTHPMHYAKIDNKVAASCDKTMSLACTFWNNEMLSVSKLCYCYHFNAMCNANHAQNPFFIAVIKKFTFFTFIKHLMYLVWYILWTNYFI
jgi:hypothetical protein